jgi:hypothetical protein
MVRLTKRAHQSQHFCCENTPSEKLPNRSVVCLRVATNLLSSRRHSAAAEYLAPPFWDTWLTCGGTV